MGLLASCCFQPCCDSSGRALTHRHDGHENRKLVVLVVGFGSGVVGVGGDDAAAVIVVVAVVAVVVGGAGVGVG